VVMVAPGGGGAGKWRGWTEGRKGERAKGRMGINIRI